MNIAEKLLNMQLELKAPKKNRNNFGNYNFRSLEDICEAVKPIAKKHNVLVKFTERVEHIGLIEDKTTNEGGEFITQVPLVNLIATCKVIDVEDPESSIESDGTALLEFRPNKGQQFPQVSGAGSSYARKYAICSLFCIDDSSNDPDATNEHKKPSINMRSQGWTKACEYVKEHGQEGLNKILGQYTVTGKSLEKLKSLIN